MEKKINKHSLFSLIIAIIIVVGALIQLLNQGEYIIARRLRAIIGYCVIIPLLLISFFTTIEVLKYYYHYGFKGNRLLYFYRIIPILLLWIYILGVIILIFLGEV